MLPASYVVQPELIYVGEFGWGGGFADVSKGEYHGLPVAIKHLRIGTKDEFNKIFKVSDSALPDTSQTLIPRQAILSGSSYLETPVSSKYRASIGSFCVEEPSISPHRL